VKVARQFGDLSTLRSASTAADVPDDGDCSFTSLIPALSNQYLSQPLAKCPRSFFSLHSGWDTLSNNNYLPFRSSGERQSRLSYRVHCDCYSTEILAKLWSAMPWHILISYYQSLHHPGRLSGQLPSYVTLSSPFLPTSVYLSPGFLDWKPDFNHAIT